MAILVITLLGVFYHSLVMASFTQYSSDEINFMHRAYLKHNPDITINEVRTRLYENQFLLQQAALKTPAIIKRQSAVGFSTQYHVERYLKNLFDSQLAIKVQSSQVKLDTYDSQWLKHTLGPYPKNGQYVQSLIKKMQQIDLTPILYNSINLYEFIDALLERVTYLLHYEFCKIDSCSTYPVLSSPTLFALTKRSATWALRIFLIAKQLVQFD